MASKFPYEFKNGVNFITLNGNHNNILVCSNPEMGGLAFSLPHGSMLLEVRYFYGFLKFSNFASCGS
jgi:hypothetical protein